jgi:hypothetical protein
LLCWLLFIATNLWADDVKDTAHIQYQINYKSYYFYHGLTFGSEGKYSPGDFFINGGFGIWQFSDDRKLLNMPIETEWNNTRASLTHPMTAIENFGVKEWLTSEVIPTSTDFKHGQWFPNYFTHVIGAGMQSRKMEEWY